MLKDKKMKSFWKDTEAISPIIATIMVLVVAVAAGAGLYFWFDTFQASAQEQVGSASDSQFNVLGSSTTPIIVTMDTTQNVQYASASYDKKDGYDDYGALAYAGYNYDTYKTGIACNKSATPVTVFKDERFVLEIPIELKANANLHNVKIKVDLDNKEILESGYPVGYAYEYMGFSPYCLHLDRTNGYALQYYDTVSSSWKTFNGELHPNSDAITFDDTKYNYRFDGDKPALNLSSIITAAGDISDLGLLGLAETDDGIYNETNLAAVTYPDRQSDLGSYYKSDPGAYMLNGRIITAEGKAKYARKVSVNDVTDETPWVTTSTLLNSKGASNSDAQDAYLLSNTYPIGDIGAGEIKTAYVYVYVNFARFNADSGMVVATVPFEFSSADGFSTSETITFTLYEGMMS